MNFEVTKSQSLPALGAISRISVTDFFHLDETEKANAIILDLGQAQTYARGHLPGAVRLPIARIVRQSGYATGLAPDESDLLQLAQDFDLTSGKTVYLYDDEGGGWAGRMAWILDILKAPNIVYIDGGLRAWLAAGFALESVSNLPVKNTSFDPASQALNWTPNVLFNEMKQLVKNVDVQFLDARSLGEFQGSRQFAQRAGRIPGAQHFEWIEGMDINQGSVIRPLPELRERLALAGIDGARTIVTYCQTHHRSGFTYLICRLLGFKVRAYAGSWSEWGNATDVPVEQGL